MEINLISKRNRSCLTPNVTLITSICDRCRTSKTICNGHRNQGAVNGYLEPEQPLGVRAGNLRPVGVADGSMVKPLVGLDNILVRIIDRVKDAVSTEFENYVRQGLRVKVPTRCDVEILSQVMTHWELCARSAAAPAYAIIHSPNANR